VPFVLDSLVDFDFVDVLSVKTATDSWSDSEFGATRNGNQIPMGYSAPKNWDIFIISFAVHGRSSGVRIPVLKLMRRS